MHAPAPGAPRPGPPAAALPPDPAVWVTEQFPGWQAWASQTGRWWARHDGTLTPGQADAGCLRLLHTYSPEDLAARLREQETLRRQAASRAAASQAAIWPATTTRPTRLGRTWQH